MRASQEPGMTAADAGAVHPGAGRAADPDAGRAADPGTARAGAELAPPDLFINPAALRQLPDAARTQAPLEVHRRLPGYAPTPLVRCPDLAAQLGVADLWVKDESWRLGLPAFKMLGASYACYRVLTGRLGREVRWESVDELAAALAPLRPLTLCAATDGNHGQAVARMARLLGLRAAICVPDDMAAPRIEAIAAEGADVTLVSGGYDAAVRRSAEADGDRRIVVSDTSWPGYTQIPGWVIDGYSTVFAEVAGQLAEAGRPEPDVVVIPVGVGALAAATIRHYKAGAAARPARLLGVEPDSARCVTESLRAGHLVNLPFPQTSIMSGLNCGTPSQVAWPLVSRGMDVMAVVSDGWAMAAMRALAAAGVVAGETGAAALAGLQALCADPAGADVRSALGLSKESSVLLLCTEGATDPLAWERIVGYPVPDVAS
jgi:diaminopropionate ammonia-lyase